MHYSSLASLILYTTPNWWFKLISLNWFKSICGCTDNRCFATKLIKALRKRFAVLASEKEVQERLTDGKWAAKLTLGRLGTIR